MSNYVRNYVFCDELLQKEFAIEDYRCRIFDEIIYNTKMFQLGDGRYLLIFETRGMDYRDTAIRKAIEVFRDTIWYCVEENNIQQGKFWHDGCGVASSMRNLAEPGKGCLISLEYTDRDGFPIMSVYVFSDRIIVEEFLHNRNTVIPLKDVSCSNLMRFSTEIYDALRNARKPYGEYTLSPEPEIWIQCCIWDMKTSNRVFIENEDSALYQEGDPEDGEKALLGIKTFIEKLCLENGVSIRLSYGALQDFL